MLTLIMTADIKDFDLAKFGEEEACKFLKKKGYKILDCNYKAAKGEIDIVVRSGNTIIFVEVKTRSNNRFAEPWEAVGYRKRNSVRSAAKQYIAAKGLQSLEFRFDVISITLGDGLKPQIEWIQNAF